MALSRHTSGGDKHERFVEGGLFHASVEDELGDFEGSSPPVPILARDSRKDATARGYAETPNVQMTVLGD